MILTVQADRRAYLAVAQLHLLVPWTPTVLELERLASPAAA